MSEETFDIRDVLANRAYPTTHVDAWTSEEGFFKLAAMEAAAADTTDEIALADIEQKIQNLKDELNAGAVHVYLRGTSRRAREDMITEAMVQFPVKRDVMGRDDELQTYKRGKLLTELYFAAHIQKLESNGRTQVLDDENRRAVAHSLLAELPEYSVILIDGAIAALRGEVEMQQGVDFLSLT